MGAEGSVKHATFDLAGQMFMCIDSPAKHAFTFTLSIGAGFSPLIGAHSRPPLIDGVERVGDRSCVA
jgi:predicted 3-demethylubiquinone-9 3-methyltransferase (glyoxalase superfamily)